jgi:phage-related protein
MKTVEFIGSSLDDMSAFPIEVRRAVGHELWQVQNGLKPSDYKPMPVIGSGAYEIRVHLMGEWRVIYVAKFEDTVYVLHAFHKKTQATRQQDIEVARRRYRQIGK